MRLVAMDLETPQDVPEYGLQPWRAKTGEATIKSVALWSADGVFKSAKAMPSKKYFAEVLAICAEQKYVICGWNLLFDIAWLMAIGLEQEVKACTWIDGMLVLKRVDGWRDKEYGGIGFGLKETVADVWPELEEWSLGEDVTKVPQTEEEWGRLLTYNLLDSQYTCQLTEFFWNQLSPEERKGAKIEMLCLPDIALSYINGITINVAALDELQASVTESLAENSVIFGADPKIVASPAKLGQLLFEEWGFTPIKKTPAGKPATDKETLLKLAIQHPDDPRFGALMALRKCKTRQSKFIDGVRKSLAYHGGDVTYPKPAIAGTYTGRLTYSSKQNVKVPRKGKKETVDESDE